MLTNGRGSGANSVQRRGAGKTQSITDLKGGTVARKKEDISGFDIDENRLYSKITAVAVSSNYNFPVKQPMIVP